MKTYKDVYKFPLRLAKYGTWVYDDTGHFVFQFEIDDKRIIKNLLEVINGVTTLIPDKAFSHYQGIIANGSNEAIICIRGWGNLTGTGGMNLPAEEAANIQDTFADFIVEQLNR